MVYSSLQLVPKTEITYNTSEYLNCCWYGGEKSDSCLSKCYFYESERSDFSGYLNSACRFYFVRWQRLRYARIHRREIAFEKIQLCQKLAFHSALMRNKLIGSGLEEESHEVGAQQCLLIFRSFWNYICLSIKHWNVELKNSKMYTERSFNAKIQNRHT